MKKKRRPIDRAELRRRAMALLAEAGAIDVMLSSTEAAYVCSISKAAIWTWRNAIYGRDHRRHRFWISRRKLVARIGTHWPQVPVGVRNRLAEFDGRQPELMDTLLQDDEHGEETHDDAESVGPERRRPRRAG